MVSAPTLDVVRPAPAPAPSQPGERHRGDVQGLRAVAVLLVVAFHAGVPFLTGGYIGVDTFFVVSGFLITGLMLREGERTGRVRLLGFYARRARRILPASTLVLLATVLASYRFLGFLLGTGVAKDAKWSSVFLADIHFGRIGTDYFHAGAAVSPLQHFWSLAVEEQFYFVWPGLLALLLLVARKHPRRVVAGFLLVVTVASYAWSVHQTASNVTVAYFSPFTRACELSAGALGALLVARAARVPSRVLGALGVLGLAGLAACALLLTPDSRFPGSLVALPVLSTLAVLLSGTGPAASLLSLRPMQRVGDASYSLYLWHWPLLTIWSIRQGHLSGPAAAVLVVVAYVLSELTLRFVENPFRFSRPLRTSTLRSLAAGAVLVSVALGASVVAQHSHRAPGPTARATALTDPATVLAQLAAAPSIQKLPSGLTPALQDAGPDFGPVDPSCLSDFEVTVAKACLMGDPTGTRTVVLYGDSHAAMWAPALDLLGRKDGWKVYLVSKTACPDPDVSIQETQLVRPYTECDAWHADVLSRIGTLHPDLVVVTSLSLGLRDAAGERIGPDAWRDAWVRTIGRLAAPGRRVVMIGDIGYPVQDAAQCSSLHSSDVQRCSLPVADAETSPFKTAEREAAQQAGIDYVDPTPMMCTTVCSPVVGTTLVYNDRFHVTATFAALVASLFEKPLGLG